MASPPNPRLQRTRAAVLLQTVRGESSLLLGVRRAPLSRRPLGGRSMSQHRRDTNSFCEPGACHVTH